MSFLTLCELQDMINSVYMTEIASFVPERWLIYATPQPMVSNRPFVRLAVYPGLYVNYHIDLIGELLQLTITV